MSSAKIGKLVRPLQSIPDRTGRKLRIHTRVEDMVVLPRHSGTTNRGTEHGQFRSNRTEASLRSSRTFI